MNAITDWLGGLSGPLVYAAVGALVFTEDALFFGFVLPRKTAVVLGGVLADQGPGLGLLARYDRRARRNRRRHRGPLRRPPLRPENPYYPTAAPTRATQREGTGLHPPPRP
ncbi:hypothetical protein [Streptomyces sp. NPDC058247]|uniref:hypothetical protein n=1 Tax=Streptomyces sp. NPDC058247 TaxID=3346401 RepID=UPI0036EA959B